MGRRAGQLTGARLEAVYAYDFEVAWVGEPGRYFEEWRKQAETQGRARLDEVISDVTGGSQEVPVSAVAIEGPATPTLLDASTDADLLVVGSRGRGGFTGLLLGPSASTAPSTPAARSSWSRHRAEPTAVRRAHRSAAP